MLLFTKEGIPSVSTHLINNNQSWLTYGASEWKSGIPHTPYVVVNLNIPLYKYCTYSYNYCIQCN